MWKFILTTCVFVCTISHSEGTGSSTSNLLNLLPYMLMNKPNNNNNNNNYYQQNNPQYGQGYGSPFPNSGTQYQQPSNYNNMRCIPSPSSRLPCGQQGINQYNCQNAGCCWDTARYLNIPQCYKPTSFAQPQNYGRVTQSPVGTNNNIPPQQQYQQNRQPYQPPTNPPYQHATNPPYQPVTNPPYQPATNPPYQPATNPPYQPATNPPYQPQTQKPSAPAPTECVVPANTPVILCGAESISEAECLAKGCCYKIVYQVLTCYHKPSGNNNVATFVAPSVIPKTPAYNTPPTQASEIDLRALLEKMEAELLAKRKNMNKPNLNGGTSVFDILKGLESQNTPSTEKPYESVLPKVATPPPKTTRKIIPSYTPPVYTTQAPVTRWQCNYGSCRWVVVPPRMCYPQECGIPKFTPKDFPNFNSQRKIVGGSRAYPFTHPWNVMIQKIEGSKTFICGATLICKRWLITAAHCLDRQQEYRNTADLDPNMYKIYVGRYTGWKLSHGKQVQVFKGAQGIERMIQHESFIPGKHRGVITHDIALIKLRRDVVMNRYVQPACLPREGAKAGQTMFATGWGVTKNKGPDDSALKQVGVKINAKQTCKNSVPGFVDPPGVICAGGEQNHDTCTGDSGGPLVGSKTERGSGLFSSPTARWYVYGLTSIGSPSCNVLRYDRQPAVYTDVHYYLKWIQSHTRHCCA